MNPQKIELTKANHFEFGRLPEDPDVFISKIGEAHEPVLDARDQAAKDARTIFETSGKEFVDLCLSGGIDSECMLESFLLAKVPMKIHFFRFKDGLNDFDIETNIAICKSKNLDFQIHEFDILHFFESGKVFDISNQYECQSPQISAHLWMLDQVEGFPCLSGNPIAPIWRKTSWFYVGLPGEMHSAYFKYFLIQDRPGVPWFFIYSPELMKSFFNLPMMKPYLEKKIQNPEEYTYLEKCKSYQEAGFTAKPRVNKFTGFERIREYYDQKMGTSYGTGFDLKFRKPLEEKWGFPEKYYQLVPQRMFDGN